MSQSVFTWLDRLYFSTPVAIRRTIGRSIVLLLFLVLCVGIYSGISALFRTDPNEYSGSSVLHRSFPVDNRQPQRHITSFNKLFDDLNDVQLAAAKKLGIHPVATRQSLEDIKSKLVELHDTQYYVIDNLTQSVPYLVPDAADFLTALGKLVQEYNGTKSRFIITSVLRTDEDVSHLKRSNGNASENSCHRYGTTVDIVYTRFELQGTTEGQFKLDLARALADLRDAGYCYVRYELKQPCFHITVRP